MMKRKRLILVSGGIIVLLIVATVVIVPFVRKSFFRFQMPGHKPMECFYSEPDMVAFCEAVILSDMKTMDRYLKTGKVDVNKVGKEGVTPLLMAFKTRNKEAFLKLLQNGADPNLQNNGWCPIALAVDLGEYDFVALCLQHKGNPNLYYEDRGNTLIGLSISSADIKMLKMLLDAGADPNLPSLYGSFTAIEDAATVNLYDMVLFLLERGAKLEAKDKETLVKCLKDNLNNPNFNHFGKSMENKEKVVDYLEKKGVDVKELRVLISGLKAKNGIK
ncbi:MAG: ankyrin repeat domain-containing protein [Victivallales bacterium]